MGGGGGRGGGRTEEEKRKRKYIRASRIYTHTYVCVYIYTRFNERAWPTRLPNTISHVRPCARDQTSLSLTIRRGGVCEVVSHCSPPGSTFVIACKWVGTCRLYVARLSRRARALSMIAQWRRPPPPPPSPPCDSKTTRTAARRRLAL